MHCEIAANRICRLVYGERRDLERPIDAKRRSPRRRGSEPAGPVGARLAFPASAFKSDWSFVFAILDGSSDKLVCLGGGSGASV